MVNRLVTYLGPVQGFPGLRRGPQGGLLAPQEVRVKGRSDGRRGREACGELVGAVIKCGL